MRFTALHLEHNDFLHHLLPLAFICLISTVIIHSVTANAQTTDINEIQELVQRWMIIEKQETALITNWQSQEQTLIQRLELLEEEKLQLTKIISSNTNDNDAVNQRRLSLLEIQNTMEKDQLAMESTLSSAMGSINNLHAQLPPPMKQAWQNRLDILASEVESSTQNNSNIQLQALVEMLNQLEDFQQRISVNQNTIILNNGSEILVKQLYLGLSHAWYVSADGQYSGYGQSQDDGWVWLDQPVVEATTVQRAINMLERNVDVELIELPLVLQTLPKAVQVQLANNAEVE